MADAAGRSDDRNLVAEATLLRAAALIELGDPAGRAELVAYVELADSLGHARGRWQALSRRATVHRWPAASTKRSTTPTPR